MSLTGNAEGKTLRGKINRLAELRGYSAYEIAVINGFSGTEKDWLESLTMLTSPSGKHYKLKVDDDGTLSTEAV